MIQLRLYNPVLTDRKLTRGRHVIAHPRARRNDVFDVTQDGGLQYRARIGDNYLNLAFAFGADIDHLRTSNELWRLQPLPRDMVLTIPLDSPDTLTEHNVRLGEDLVTVAARLQTDPWQLVRDNHLWTRTFARGW